MTDDNLLMPAGAVLVHVGPYKTGTSDLQMALHVRRDVLVDHGVCYPGTAYRHLRPSAALLGRSPRGIGHVEVEEWDALVAEVKAAFPHRSVISSEGLSSANTAQVAKLVDDLGGEHVYAVAVARRLDRLLPSVWQEQVKSANEVRPYDDWLDSMLARDLDKKSGRTFWHAHGLKDFLDSWSSVLPREQIVVIVGDERDRGLLTRTFEQFLGLPERLLSAGDRPNSSLSWEKTEVYRRLNEIFDEQGWSNRERRRYLQRGMLSALRDHPPTRGEVRLPRLDAARAQRVLELSRERAALVRDAGVRVVGDPDALLSDDILEDAPDVMPPAPELVGVDAAALAIEGILRIAFKNDPQARRRQAERQSRATAS
jgi:hypothetical protein